MVEVNAMKEVGKVHSVLRGCRTAVTGLFVTAGFVASLWALSSWTGAPAIPPSSYGVPMMQTFANP
jgi:hypothetical protein